MASVVAADLVAYHAATQSDVDGSTVGGAIDTLRRPDFTQIAANDTIQALSSAAGDTAITVTMTGRSAAGSIVTETKTLTGTTAITFNTLGTVERVLQAELSAAAAGTITIQRTTGAVLIRTIPIGERGFSAIFRKGSSSTSGTVNYYAKFFWKNTNATNALLGAAVSESADPSGTITHGLAASVNDSGTTTNRQTAPGGVTFAGTAANVPGTDLAATAAIGVWLNMTLATNNAAIRSTYTSQIAGSTT
jgi:hypothetical protein